MPEDIELDDGVEERDPEEAQEDIGFPDDFSVSYPVWQDDDDVWHGKDEHGQFHLDAGSPTPVNSDDYNYEPCGAVLTYTFDRYGERRYCEGMALSNFDEDAHDREHDDFCKVHQSRGSIQESIQERSKHLAFAASFETMFEYLDVHKKVLAIEMFRSLLGESSFDFDPANETKEFDVEGSSEIFGGVDTVEMEFPVPQEHVVRAKSLYFAALNYVQMENIMEEQFRVAAEETGPEGEPLAVGERTKVVTVDENMGVIEDRDEHHLNLPLSRIQKDYERHLDVGGVSTDSDEEVSDGEAREWILKVEEDTDEPAPEATSDSNPMTSLDTPDE